MTENHSVTSERTWTILALLEWSTDYLASRGFEDARLNVELLLAHVLRLTRLQLYTQFDRPLNRAELDAYKSLLMRRLNHEPLQYILGETEFMGMLLYVNSSVLIPRPETEQLVERALEAIRFLNQANVSVLDIGTGSANIAIALGSREPDANITAIDVSPSVLETAKRNVERHHLKNISLVHADVLGEFLPDKVFDIIVSNPPYISATEFETLQPEVRDFEPRISTTDDGDGFRFIRRISEIAVEWLKEGGYVLMELAYNQSEQAKVILTNTGLKEVQVFDDLSGIPRIIRARK